VSERGGGGRARPDGFDPVLHPEDLDDLGVKDYPGEGWVAPPEPPPSPGSEEWDYDPSKIPPKEASS
jgi:hypothetical protein